MGKRSNRKAARNDATVHALFTERLRTDTAKGEAHYSRNVRPKSQNQARFIASLEAFSMVLGLGPAGTGKTYLAVSKAVEALERGDVNRIVLCRPAVEAGESLGYLPGDVEAKLAPYLRPIHDVLLDRLGSKRVKAFMAEDLIEIAPVAYMRGRTLNNAFVVIDEAQNCTYGQLKMMLTRLGWNTTMVLTGDPDQCDLLPGLSGLSDIARRLDPLERTAIIRFDTEDIVRHPLVADMLGVL